MEIKLNLSIEEVNLILASLQKQPYEVVASLVAKIKTEGDGQVKEQNDNLQHKKQIK